MSLKTVNLPDRVFTPADMRMTAEALDPIRAGQPKSKRPRHLFVTGHARSGSTILMDVLNSSPDVFILDEAELYWNRRTAEFASYFNKRAAIKKYEVAKGRFVPPEVAGLADGDALLARLARYYRLTGDKVALGPNRDEQVHIFHYLTGRHLDAYHIFTIRRPETALVSMHEMFPDIPGGALIDVWLDTLSLVVCGLHIIPRSYVVPLDRLSDDVLHRLADLLDIDPIISPQSLWPEKPISQGDLSWLSETEGGKLRGCANMYNELSSLYDSSTLRFFNPGDAYRMPWHVLPALRAVAPQHCLLVDRIWQPVTATTDFRRPVIDAALNRGSISDREKSLIDEYVRAYPEDGFAHYAAGFARLHRGEDFTGSIREFSVALKHGYLEFWTRYNRGCAYEKLGDLESAVADLERAADLDATHEGVQQHLAYLRTQRQNRVA